MNLVRQIEQEAGLSEKGLWTVNNPDSWPIAFGGGFSPWTPKGLKAWIDLDTSFIGTPDYVGYAYFWAYEYRHYMRDSSPYRRRLVHKKLMAAGLSLSGESPAHDAIIRRYARPR